MDMKNWFGEQIQKEVKKAIPVLSFPSTQLLNISVIDLISSSEMQSKGMKMIADRCDTGASLSMMDLSVEAQAFGAEVRIVEDEVPTVIGRLVTTREDVDSLRVPDVGAGRTGIYIESIEKAVKLITDRPVFAGVIGPFSLSGRLMDMTEIMVNCYTEPETVHAMLHKATEFLIRYIKGYKQVGANGVVIAEPAAGLLSPEFVAEFSSPYVRRIVEAVSGRDFGVIYHNCGKTIPLIDSILTIGADAYHFGNAIQISEMLKAVPADIPVLGNIDPSGEFRNGTPESIREATLKVLKECHQHKNFIISSGCDIPPLASWANIDAFFAAVKSFYSNVRQLVPRRAAEKAG
jgi:uroporphyrinogen decarboxylase